MSWNKNTHVCSEIDTIISSIKELLPEEKYTVTYLGELPGMGLNDNGDKKYSIRKLEFRDSVVIEQMQRCHDCDSDDMIVSFKYRKDRAPTHLPIEVYMDCEEFGCSKHSDGTCSPEENPYSDYDTELESLQEISRMESLEEENVNEDDEGTDIYND